MTLKEADEAAWKFLPIRYNGGAVYKRITQTGYRYDERRGRVPFVQLLDQNSNSVINVDPALCEVIDFSEMKTEKE